MSSNSNPNITIYIERLILDGLPITHGQHPLLQAAIEAELDAVLPAQVRSPRGPGRREGAPGQ